jgi:nitroreductase
MNMEIINIIHKRRSIRSFKDTPIAEGDMRIILSAGMTAPSACDKQPWRFVIVTDNDKKREIAKISQYAQMTVESPVSILVCGDKNESFLNYYPVDCAACIQNMLLSACALGIGSVWTGINESTAGSFKKLFNLPKQIEPIAFVVFGYSDAEFVSRNYFDSKKIHFNEW